MRYRNHHIDLTQLLPSPGATRQKVERASSELYCPGASAPLKMWMRYFSPHPPSTLSLQGGGRSEPQ